MTGWIGVDLDGTLASYSGWKSETQIGEPVPAMVAKVKRALALGWEVRIMTARVSTRDPEELHAVRSAILTWCIQHLGVGLEVTCVKDYAMVELWDDRAVQVTPNTGEFVGASRILGGD